jgi:hypothetical protein
MLGDPLAPLFQRLFSTKPWLAALAALLIGGTLVVGVGLLVSNHYEQKGQRFLALSDPREFPMVVLVSLITIPLIWYVYVWQPGAISRIFVNLHDAGVLGEPIKTNLEIMPRFERPWRRFIPLAVFLSAIVGIWVWLSVLSPDNPDFFGEPAKWWQVNRLYFWILWIPLTLFINLYFFFWILVRQSVATVALNRICLRFDLKPRLFHPDGCNGFSGVGDYVISITWGVVYFGFWLFVYIGWPALFEGQPSLRADSIALLIVYIVAIPACLVLPVLRFHQEMHRKKDSRLLALADQIAEFASETRIVSVIENRELLQELERRYQVYAREYHTWPFRRPWITRLIVVAAIPFLSSLVTALLDRLLVSQLP